MFKHLLLLLIFFFSAAVFAGVDHPFYVGIQGGYGNTDWARLISQDDASATATPEEATGDGFAYGGLVGYQFAERLAIEADYLRFPDSDLTFLTPNIYNVTSLTSKTQYFSIIAKIFVLTNSDFRIFGDMGWGKVLREDEMADISNAGVTFGVGADYSISEHWLALFSFEYTPGTGVAAENASALYVPYVYSMTLGLAYRL